MTLGPDFLPLYLPSFNRFKAVLSIGLVLACGLAPQMASAQCTPTSASLCVTGDDYSQAWVNGTALGTFPYAGAPGTTGAANPTCMTVPVVLLTGSQVSLAVYTQNTAPQNTYTAWDLDVTCSNGLHSEITSASGGLAVTYAFGCNPCAPPANDGGGNPWYSPNYSGNAFTSSYCSTGVTLSTWAAALYDPTTGIRLPFVSNNCSGDYGTSNGALFWRQSLALPAPTPVMGPANFTITESQGTPVTDTLSNTVTINDSLVVCNTGGPVANGPLTVTEYFTQNVSSCNPFQFGCWGYGDDSQPYTLCYYSSANQNANEPTASGNYLIFPSFPGNTCVTLTGQLVDYYYPAGCCVTVARQAAVSWSGGNVLSNSVTYGGTCVPTNTPTFAASGTPTSTFTPAGPTATWTRTPSPTPTFTGGPMTSPTLFYLWTQTATFAIPSSSYTPTYTPTFTLTPTATTSTIITGSNYCASPTTFVSIATTYNSIQGNVSLGNCGFPSGNVDPNYYAAIAAADYQNGMACGACLAVLDTDNSNSVTLMVVDQCPTCSTAHQLDLGPTAYNSLTQGANPGSANIAWSFVPCPLSLMGNNSSGNINYQWKTGCSAFYNPIQFMDMVFPITNVAFSSSVTGPYTALVMGANGVGGDEYWGTPSGNLNSTSGPFYFALKDGPGQSVTLGPIALGSCGVTNATASQFPICGSPTATPTITFTAANTNTPTITVTGANTGTPTSTGSPTPTGSLVTTATMFYYLTQTATFAMTPSSSTPTITFTAVNTNTPTITVTGANTATPTSTSMVSVQKMILGSAPFPIYGGSGVTFLFAICNLGGSTQTVTLTDNTSGYNGGQPRWLGSRDANGGNILDTNLHPAAASVPVSYSQTSSSWPTNLVLFNLPPSQCATLGFHFQWDTAPPSCAVFSDYASVSYFGPSTSTSNTIAITQACTSVTPTSTFTGQPPTATWTSTFTPTPTFSLVFSPTSSGTNTATRTFTPSWTPTNTVVTTLTLEYFWTQTATFAIPPSSYTPTYTPTVTSTPVNTNTPTITVTGANTSTATDTRTATFTPTFTFSIVLTPTRTFTPSPTISFTPIPPTATWVFQMTQTATFGMGTLTSTPTSTFTALNTNTPTISYTPSNTGTPSFTPIPSNSPTFTFTPTNTFTRTFTPSPTISFTPIPPTATWVFQMTQTATFAMTPSSSTPTPSFTPVNTNTPTITVSGANTTTPTFSNTSTVTNTGTFTWTPTVSLTVSISYTILPTSTVTSVPSLATFTFTNTPTFTATRTSTATFTLTATSSSTHTATSIPPFTNTPTAASTSTFTASPTNSPVLTNTSTVTPVNTATPTSTPATVLSPVATATPTGTSTPKPVVYPNPCDGTRPIRVHLPNGPQPNCHIKIYTTTYRKVRDQDCSGQGALSEIPLDMVDDQGNKLGNGLYIVQLTCGSGRYNMKVLLLR